MKDDLPSSPRKQPPSSPRKQPPSSPRKRGSSDIYMSFWISAFAGMMNVFLLLLTPFSFFLYQHDYPLFYPEVGAVLCALLVVSMFLAWWRIHLKITGQIIFNGLLITFALSFFPWPEKFMILPLILIVTVLLNIFLEKYFNQIALVSCSVFLVMQFFSPHYKEETKYSFQPVVNLHANPEQKNLPTLLHIIVDEHQALDQQQVEINKIYTQHQLIIFSRVYSRYSNSLNSIANLFNFSEMPRHRAYFLSNGGEGGVLSKNAYFDKLARLGYRVHVYEPAYIHYCDHPAVVSCHIYPAAQAKVLTKIHLMTSERTRFFIFRFLTSSLIFKTFKNFYFSDIYPMLLTRDWPLWSIFHWNDRYTSVTSLSVLSHVSHEMHFGGGHAYFIHLLLPHAPYVYTKTCQLKPIFSWSTSTDSSPLLNSPDSLIARTQAYRQQTFCLANKLNNLLGIVEARTQGRVKILIHGDHGSRIVLHSPDIANAKLMQPMDYHNAFSTFFAIRDPAAGRMDENAVYSLSQLFALWAGESMQKQSENYVYLVPDKSGEFLKKALNHGD